MVMTILNDDYCGNDDENNNKIMMMIITLKYLPKILYHMKNAMIYIQFVVIDILIDQDLDQPKQT